MAAHVRFDNLKEPLRGDFDYSLKGIKWEVVTIFSSIKPGDHISYYKFPYYHHAVVVEEVNQDNQMIDVVGWELWRK